MAILQSILKIYDDASLTNLIGTYPDAGNDKTETVTSLSPGTRYWATVISENSYGNWNSPYVYSFTTIPQINLTGIVNRNDDGFIRNVTITTTADVTVDTYGLEYDVNSSFTNSTKVASTTINGLDEHTTYYYRPWVRDVYGREWVNTSDVDSVTTLYAKPVVEYAQINGSTLTTFDCSINVISLDTVSSVYAELTTSGVTTTINLTASQGIQHVLLSGLTPNTNYTVVFYAVNSSGTGNSVAYNFTTQQQIGQVDVIIRGGQLVSSVDNSVTVTCDLSYDPDEITIISNSIYIYDNDLHLNTPVDSDTSILDSFTTTLTNVVEDTDYYVFGKAEYTIGADPTVYTQWSIPVAIRTYSLLSFISLTPGNTDCVVVYTVDGASANTQMEYSVDNVNWTTVAILNPQGGTVTITGLTPNTNYYIRGRAQNQAGWQTFVEDTFTTTGVVPLGIHLNNISNITGDSATINLTITNNQ